MEKMAAWDTSASLSCEYLDSVSSTATSCGLHTHSRPSANGTARRITSSP
jgi:hypothetical protein